MKKLFRITFLVIFVYSSAGYANTPAGYPLSSYGTANSQGTFSSLYQLAVDEPQIQNGASSEPSTDITTSRPDVQNQDTPTPTQQADNTSMSKPQSPTAKQEPRNIKRTPKGERPAPKGSLHKDYSLKSELARGAPDKKGTPYKGSVTGKGKGYEKGPGNGGKLERYDTARPRQPQRQAAERGARGGSLLEETLRESPLGVGEVPSFNFRTAMPILIGVMIVIGGVIMISQNRTTPGFSNEQLMGGIS